MCGDAARGAAAPVDDFGFVDLEAVIVVGGQAWHGPDSAVDVKHAATGAADQMMVVVADAILETCRRASGLNAANEVLVDEHAQRVIHGLARDGANHGADVVGEVIGRRVRTHGEGAHDGQPLRSYLHSMRAKQLLYSVGRVNHESIQSPILDSVNY